MALFELFKEKSSLRGVAIVVWVVVASGVLVAKYGTFWTEGGPRIAEATEPGLNGVDVSMASPPDARRSGPAENASESSDIEGESSAEGSSHQESSPGIAGTERPDPRDPSALFERGRSLESEGRFAEAIATYEALLLAQEESAPELLLRLGRVHYRADRPVESLAWYDRYLDRVNPSDSMVTVLRWERARALFDAGQPEEALHSITTEAGPSCGSVDRMVLGARAATASGETDTGIGFLECLRGTEALTVERRMWLAGLRRASGTRESALAEYEAILPDLPSGPMREEALRAIGDLRLDSGDSSGALDAYSALPEGPDRTLLLARAHQAGGELEAAAPLWERYVEMRPDDLDSRLSLARLYAALRRPDPALRHYRAVVAADATLVPEIELARISMAAGDFLAAAQWAERAMKAERDYWEAGLTLAAAYRFMGRRQEAERLFTMLENRSLAEPEIDLWRGRVSLARGAHLDAWMELSRFLESGGSATDEVRLLQAQASLGRQDIRRTRETLERIGPGRGDSIGFENLAARADSITRPWASAPAEYTKDANGLSRRIEALDAVLWPWSTVRMEGRVGRATLEQESVRRSALSFGLSADRFFPAPSLELGASVALDRIELGPLSYSGDLWGRWSFSDGSEIELSASRDLLWNSGPALDHQEPTRIVDLAGLGPAPYVQGIRVSALKAFGEHRHLLADGGRVTYPDGNRQDFLYGQVQIPLETGVGAWTVLTPRLYAESFQRNASEYFSPREYLSAGVGGHTIRDLGGLSFETEVVPQIFWTRDETGVAVRGLLKTTFPLVGPLRPQVGGYAYLQDDDYYVYQAFARVSVPLGGGVR